MKIENARKTLGSLILMVGLSFFVSGCASAPPDESAGNAFLASVDADVAAKAHEAEQDEHITQLADQVNRLTAAVVELLEQKKAELAQGAAK